MIGFTAIVTGAAAALAVAGMVGALLLRRWALALPLAVLVLVPVEQFFPDAAELAEREALRLHPFPFSLFALMAMVPAMSLLALIGYAARTIYRLARRAG